MSELAFDSDGEPVAFPAEAEELRVRRFRNPGARGACELVRDQAGAPLYVPVDSGYLELLAAVDRVPGRYRLDAVDGDRQQIEGATPAYVMINEPRNSSQRGGEDHNEVIRELARANADMARTMADKFADVMQAAADLLRAADGAGLTRRAPAPVEPQGRNAVDETEDDDEEEGDELEEEDEKGEVPDVASLIAQMMPMLQMWLATKRSAPQATVATGQVQVPVEPAPDGGDAVRNGRLPSPARETHLLAIYNKLDPTARRTAEAAVRRMPSDVQGDWLDELCALTVEEGAARVRSMIPERPPQKEVITSGADAPAVESPIAGVPTAAVQVMAIYAALDPHEKRIVEAIALRTTADERAEWVAQLCALPTAEAVALVRSLIPSQGQEGGAGDENGRTPTGSG